MNHLVDKVQVRLVLPQLGERLQVIRSRRGHEGRDAELRFRSINYYIYEFYYLNQMYEGGDAELRFIDAKF